MGVCLQIVFSAENSCEDGKIYFFSLKFKSRKDYFSKNGHFTNAAAPDITHIGGHGGKQIAGN